MLKAAAHLCIRLPLLVIFMLLIYLNLYYLKQYYKSKPESDIKANAIPKTKIPPIIEKPRGILQYQHTMAPPLVPTPKKSILLVLRLNLFSIDLSENRAYYISQNVYAPSHNSN
jgi:hypothetical protein